MALEFCLAEWVEYVLKNWSPARITIKLRQASCQVPVRLYKFSFAWETPAPSLRRNHLLISVLTKKGAGALLFSSGLPPSLECTAGWQAWKMHEIQPSGNAANLTRKISWQRKHVVRQWWRCLHMSASSSFWLLEAIKVHTDPGRTQIQKIIFDTFTKQAGQYQLIDFESL